MATDPSASPSTSLVDRVKNILLHPKEEWPRIDAEPATIAGIYKGYVLILAAIPPVCMMIGLMLLSRGLFHYAPSYLVGQAILQYILSLVGVYVLALIIDALAPTFGGTKSQISAFKVAAYSMTASWVVGIVFLLPFLFPLAILGLYGFYLLYVGLPMLMKVPADKAVGYTVAVVVVAIVLYIVIGAITSAMMAMMMPPTPVSTITFSVPNG